MTSEFVAQFAAITQHDIALDGNYASVLESSDAENQQQTNEVFSEKWEKYESAQDLETFYAFQRDWYLKLYGFSDEDALRQHLQRVDTILDAGCGLGYKAAWFADLAPHALVVGVDFSTAASQAARIFADRPNLIFLRGDIAALPVADRSIGYVSCDQVIMHTEEPEITFSELSRITSNDGQFACYFYAKKALPRELLDDYFRIRCKEVSREQLWEMSEQLTELGKRLSALNIQFDAPEIPLLGIKGGQIDIQRFIYWNFLKCFWNPELGHDTSVVTNFDWYSPSNARRFSGDEVRVIASKAGMREEFFRSEEAAHSGRFSRC